MNCIFSYVSIEIMIPTGEGSANSIFLANLLYASLFFLKCQNRALGFMNAVRLIFKSAIRSDNLCL